MRKKNNLKVIVTLLIVTVLCICGVIRFFSINSKYPQNEKVVYKMGDSFVCQNAKFTITDTYMLKRMDIMNDDDLSEYLEENSDYLKSEDLNLGLIKIIISNTTDDEITVDLILNQVLFHYNFITRSLCITMIVECILNFQKVNKKRLLHPFLSLLNNFSIMIPPILETERIIWYHLYILKK